MSIEIKKTKRSFQLNINGKITPLEDPNPAMSISEVSEYHSGKYPQLLNSSYEETTEDGDLIITFKSIAGTKG